MIEKFPNDQEKGSLLFLLLLEWMWVVDDHFLV